MMINKIAGIASLALIGSIAHAKTLDTQETAPQATVTETATIKPTQKVSGLYFGMGVGTTRFDGDDFGISNDVINDNIDGNALKILVGYQFNRVFALEAQHTQYGDIYSSSPTSLSFSANLGYTFKNGLRPFGVIGLASVDLDLPSDEVDSKGVGVHYGVGVEYAPVQLKGFSARLGYETDFSAIENEEHYGSYGYSSDIQNYTLGSFYVAASYKF
jgi:opacity protein-like surface antigen